MSNPTGKIYRIASVHDFRLVPKDRREICVREFLVWLALADFGYALVDDPKDVMQPDSFDWIDDGLSHAGLKIEDQSGPVFSFAGTIKE